MTDGRFLFLNRKKCSFFKKINDFFIVLNLFKITPVFQKKKLAHLHDFYRLKLLIFTKKKDFTSIIYS